MVIVSSVGAAKLIALGVKGAAAIGNYVVHHGVSAKILAGLYKIVVTTSLAEAGAIAAGTCVVVGGYKLCERSVSDLDKGIQAVESGNTEMAFLHFGRLAFTLSRLGDSTDIPTSVGKTMTDLNFSQERIDNVVSWLSSKQTELMRVFA